MKTKCTLLLFKSPTCGPCKMFQPQLENVVKKFQSEMFELELQFADVTTDEGTKLAEQYNITSSGTAILFLNEFPNDIVCQWDRPKKDDDVLSDIYGNL